MSRLNESTKRVLRGCLSIIENQPRADDSPLARVSGAIRALLAYDEAPTPDDARVEMAEALRCAETPRR